MLSSPSVTQMMIDDLAKSGLTFEDTAARIIDENVKAAVSLNAMVPAYVFPYYNIQGKPIPYYRVRLLKPKEEGPKYLQIKNSANHVYFPKNFLTTFNNVGNKFCILTEGEKKAAACVKAGIPAVAFGGVDSWVNKTILIPKNAQMTTLGGMIGIKLPSANIDEQDYTPLAHGFLDLLDLALKCDTIFIIIYDTDSPRGVRTEVQRAAAKLGYELRFKGFGIHQIRQLVLPVIDDKDKMGLDDFLITKSGGPAQLIKLIQENLAKRTAFPQYPAVREYISRQLQKPKLDRKKMHNLSLALLTELDARGTRMYSPDDKQLYYFNGKNNHLMKVDINRPNLAGLNETEFGQLLYSDYSISPGADYRLMQWLGTQFAAEQPVENVQPYKIIARPQKGEDILRYQINNGQYIKVTGDPNQPFKIMPNGAEGVLFEALETDGITEEELQKELIKQSKQPLRNWWHDVISEVRLKFPGETAELISLLYYMSPYLMRWRGLQLPIELIIGEPGSGKSTLCEVRLNVISGDPKLRNTPKDQRDWHAAIANAGGLIITDNVHMTDKSLQQQISDELCRIVTEPDPRISMRKFYTEADERSIRVGAMFAFTAIKHPFRNSDVIQRSVILELSKGSTTNSRDEILFDAEWKDRQLERFGGRAAWVAHHMLVIHHFFKLVKKEWNPNYKAKNRLVHFEQSLRLMYKIFNPTKTFEASEWIPKFLNRGMETALEASDWTLEGLCAFAEQWRSRQKASGKVVPFSTSDIANWASSSEEYEKSHELSSSRALGKYMQSNLSMIQQIAHISSYGKKNNKEMYIVEPNSSDSLKKQLEA